MSLLKLAEVVGRRQEDGDIEHTQKKYILENDTQLRKNCWSLLCDSKNSATWQKKTKSLENARSKKIPV